MFTRSASIILACLILMTATAAAEIPLPNAANPAILQKQFEPQATPQAKPEETPAPSKETLPIPPGAETYSFTLTKLQIEGATVYSESDLRPLYEHLIGTTVTLKNIYTVAQNITVKYVTDGWVLSQALVPVQKIGADGVVHIRVAEGFIGEIIMQGDAKTSDKLLQKYCDKIRAARPLNLKTLERYLLLANDLPGITATGTLKPSDTTPEAADLILKVEQKSVDASASLDNRGSRYVGPWQSTAHAGLNNGLGLHDQTGITVATTPFEPRELKYTQISHEEQIGNEGTKILFNVDSSVSRPGDVLTDSDTRAQSFNYGAVVTHPIIRSRPQNLSVNAHLDSSNFDVKQTGFNPVFKDRLRMMRVGGTYDWSDSFALTPAVSLIELELSQGLHVLGASRTGADFLSRNQGHADFFKAAAQFSRTQKIYERWGYQLAGMGQWAGAPLLSSEQFSFGGQGFGRGYDPGAIVGDHGIAGRFELQYNAAPIKYIDNCQLYGFYDIGQVWQAASNFGPDSVQRATSFGTGIRMSLTQYIGINGELVVPENETLAHTGAGGKTVRAFIGLTANY